MPSATSLRDTWPTSARTTTGCPWAARSRTRASGCSAADCCAGRSVGNGCACAWAHFDWRLPPGSFRGRRSAIGRCPELCSVATANSDLLKTVATARSAVTVTGKDLSGLLVRMHQLEITLLSMAGRFHLQDDAAELIFAGKDGR